MAAKINLANISAGLSKVQAAASALEELATTEMVDARFILFAESNPYSTDDTQESLRQLADDVQMNGLIHPLVVNRLSADEYRLISGERRLKAITQFLHWPRIECRVYHQLPADQAQLMLHSANLETREYTTEQKLRFYKDTEALLSRMKENGTFQGAKQQRLAEMLGVTTRQIQRYKQIASLPEAIQQKVMDGEISMNGVLASPKSSYDSKGEEFSATVEAIHLLERHEENLAASYDTSPAIPNAAATIPFPAPIAVKPYAPADTEDASPSSQTELPDKILQEAVSQYYKPAELLRFYMFQVPTTQEAIKFLKPAYGYAGRSILFQDDDSGGIEWRSASVDIRYCSRHYPVTYVQIDACIREMIRGGEWKQEIKEMLTKIKGEEAYV